jgi:hypothetical protein
MHPHPEDHEVPQPMYPEDPEGYLQPPVPTGGCLPMTCLMILFWVVCELLIYGMIWWDKP